MDNRITGGTGTDGQYEKVTESKKCSWLSVRELRRDLHCDFLENIENDAAVVKSNMKRAYQVMHDAASCGIKKMAAYDDQMQGFWSFHSFSRGMPPLNLLKEIHALRVMFETVYQRIHEFQNIRKYSMYMFYEEKLFQILNKLKDLTDSFTVKLLQKVQVYADFIYQPFEYMYILYSNEFIYKFFNPVISSVRDRISNFNLLMQTTLEYAEIIRCYNDSSVGSATDMKLLMIFATVIHLIISGDVETNPGPPFDPRDLLRKEPKLSHLQPIFIQSGAACHWQIIGRALDVKVNDLIDYPKSADVMIGTVFERWSDQHKDFTWERIIQACKGYDQFGRVRHEINDFLSSPEAHKEYGDKPDFLYKESRKNANGHSNKTVWITFAILLVIAIILLTVLCIFLYQIRTLLLQGQGWPRETTCRTDCNC